jgi:hypothetical protein
MLKALYYPHTEIQSELILQNALLLWDKVEVIVPRPQWQFRRSSDTVFNRAVDLVVEERVPSSEEKQQADRALSEAAQSGFLGSLVMQSPEHWRRPEFLIYPEKFLGNTWDMLQRGGMALWVQHQGDFGVPAAIGFWMMSMLADLCAGTQVQKVTDRIDAYSWIAKHRAQALGNPYVEGLDVSQVAPAHDRLVTLSLECLDARNVTLKKLVEFREREHKHGGADYFAFRRRYLQTVNLYVHRIGKDAKTKSDVREIEREYQEEIKNDLLELKRELQINSLKALFSKEVALSAVILAGALTAPVVGLTTLATQLGGIGIIPLLKTGVELRAARQDALRKHPISWLYLSKESPITLF